MFTKCIYVSFLDKSVNTVQASNKFSEHFEIFSIYSLENMIWHFMQIVSKFAWNVYSYFLKKKKKKKQQETSSICRLLNFPKAC